MSGKQTSFDLEDEEYIDIQLSSSSNLLSISIDSHPQTKEFEFQMLSYSNEKEATSSPADELFYKGKLLPLHLPPRLQMVQDLLQGSNLSSEQAETNAAFKPSCGVSMKNELQMSQAAYSLSPLESCRVSESCRFSCEFNLDEHIFQWSNEVNGFVGDCAPQSAWCKKLKQIKLCLLNPRIKASKAYIRSLFNKFGCSTDQSTSSNAACNEGLKESRVEPRLCKKVDRKNQFETLAHSRYCRRSSSPMKERVHRHRRSFSGTVQRNSTTESSTSSASSSSSSRSSSSSFSSNRFCDMHLIKRSGIASSENESSIEGAIAHCKQSQQLCNSIAAKEH